MQLLPKQIEAIKLIKSQEKREILYGGAAGGGKSLLGVLWLIESCQKHAGSRWLMGRSKLKTLKETTLKTFFEVSSELDLSDQWEYNATAGVITFFNGSEIILKDLFLYPSDPEFDSLGSLEITGAFIDECNQISLKAWQVVKSRIRFKLKKFNLEPTILGSCNPAKNWVYKLFYLPNKNGDLASYRAFIQALPTDNPHLHPSYLESLLEMAEASKQRLYYGNWEYDDDKSAIISYDAITDYFNGNHIKPEGQKYLTIDVARKGKDKTVFRVWHGWVCIKRYEIAQGALTRVVDKAKEIQRAYGIVNTNTVADEDGVGGGVVDFLGCRGFINNSKPKQRGNFTNLKSQCSILFAKRITDRTTTELQEDPKIIDLVSEEMEQIKYSDLDKDGKLAIVGKDKIKDLIGRSPDDWDSIMMREYFSLIKSDKIRIF
jgi:PBSX family phage terminase large subunit